MKFGQVPWWAAKGSEEKEASWLWKSLFFQKRPERHLEWWENNLRLSFLCTSTDGMVPAWCEFEGPAQAVYTGWACGTGWRSSNDSKAGIISGAGRPAKCDGRAGFGMGSQSKPQICLGRQGRGQILESERSFWPMFMEKRNWDHICSRSKKADRQDKEEKGEHLGKAITKP